MVNFRVHFLALKGILGLFSDPGGGRGRRASAAESPTWSEAGPLCTCPSSGLGRKRTASDTALQQRPCLCSTCLSIPLHGTLGICPPASERKWFYTLLSSLLTARKAASGAAANQLFGAERGQLSPIPNTSHLLYKFALPPFELLKLWGILKGPFLIILALLKPLLTPRRRFIG